MKVRFPTREDNDGKTEFYVPYRDVGCPVCGSMPALGGVRIPANVPKELLKEEAKVPCMDHQCDTEIKIEIIDADS